MNSEIAEILEWLRGSEILTASWAADGLLMMKVRAPESGEIATIEVVAGEMLLVDVA